jgi:hypothetical protein
MTKKKEDMVVAYFFLVKDKISSVLLNETLNIHNHPREKVSDPKIINQD